MADEKKYEINLTLDPTPQAPQAPAAAQTAAAAAPADTAVQTAAQAVQAVEQAGVPVEKLDIDSLSPEEQAAVREFAKKIDITDTTQVLGYGSAL